MYLTSGLDEVRGEKPNSDWGVAKPEMTMWNPYKTHPNVLVRKIAQIIYSHHITLFLPPREHSFIIVIRSLWVLACLARLLLLVGRELSFSETQTATSNSLKLERIHVKKMVRIPVINKILCGTYPHCSTKLNYYPVCLKHLLITNLADLNICSGWHDIWRSNSFKWKVNSATMVYLSLLLCSHFLTSSQTLYAYIELTYFASKC